MITKEQLEHITPFTWTSEENKERLDQVFMEFVNNDHLYMNADRRKFIEDNLKLIYLMYFQGWQVGRSEIRNLAGQIINLTY